MIDTLDFIPGADLSDVSADTGATPYTASRYHALLRHCLISRCRADCRERCHSLPADRYHDSLPLPMAVDHDSYSI